MPCWALLGPRCTDCSKPAFLTFCCSLWPQANLNKSLPNILGHDHLGFNCRLVALNSPDSKRPWCKFIPFRLWRTFLCLQCLLDIFHLLAPFGSINAGRECWGTQIKPVLNSGTFMTVMREWITQPLPRTLETSVSNRQQGLLQRKAGERSGV